MYGYGLGTLLLLLLHLLSRRVSLRARILYHAVIHQLTDPHFPNYVEDRRGDQSRSLALGLTN